MLKIVLFNSHPGAEAVSELLYALITENEVIELCPDTDTFISKNFAGFANLAIFLSESEDESPELLPEQLKNITQDNELLFLYLLPRDLIKKYKTRLFEAGVDYLFPLPADKTDLKAVLQNARKILSHEKEKIDLKAKYEQYLKDKTAALENELKEKQIIENQLNDSLKKLENSQRAALNLMEDLKSEVEVRKNAESELRENERILSNLISNLPGFVYRCANDRNWTMFYISDVCEEITGYKPEHLIENRFISFNDIIKEDYREEIFNKWQSIIAEQGYFEFEYPIITKSGHEKWVWERGKGVYSEEGNLLYLEGFITDITEKKAAQEALFESEEKFRTVFMTSPDAVSVSRIDDGQYIDINKGFENITGYTRNEVIGESSVKLNIWVSSKDRELVVSKLKERGICNNIICNFRLKSGKIIFASVSASLLTINGTKCILSISRDVTELVRSREIIEQSEQKFRASFMTSPDSVSITRVSDGRIIEVNEEFCKTFGYTKEEIEQAGFNTSVLWPSPEARNEILNELELKGQILNKQVELRRKNGSTISFLASSAVIDINNEKCILSILRDVSDYLKAREELDRSREQYRNFIEKSREGIYYTEYDPPININAPADEQARHIMNRGVIKTCNNAMLGMYGFNSENELVGKGIRDLYVSTETPQALNSMIEFVNSNYHIENLETAEYDKFGNIKYFLNNTVGIISEGRLIGNWGVQRDITEQKLAEIALQESNEKLLTFIEAIPDAVFIKDGEGRWLIINKIAADLFRINGFDWSGKTEAEMAAERPEYSMMHKACDESDVEAWNNKALTFSMEMVPDLNGNPRYYEVRKLPLFRENKKHLLIVIGRDITESRKAQVIKEVQYNIANAEVTTNSISELSVVVKSELSKLIDTTNFLIALYDSKTDTFSSSFITDKHKTIHKWPGKDSLSGIVVRNKKSMLLKKQDIIKLAENNEIVLRGARAESWLGVPVKSEGKVTGIIVVQNYENPHEFGPDEISLLEQIANQLSVYIGKKKAEEDTEKLLKAIEQSPVSIVITDAAGNIEYANKFFCSITGYSQQDVVGSNPNILRSGYMSDEFYKDMWNSISSGNIWRGEILNKKRNGKLFWENSVIAPIVNESNIITHYVAVKEDVTDKKSMLEELIHAKEKAEEMNKVKSNFFSNMSHELRTPLIGIMGFSEILEEELEDNEQLLKMVKTINKGGQRLLETLNLILNLSKFEAGKIETKFDKVNIKEPVKETFDLYASAAKIKNLEYHFTASDDEIICHIDRNLLQNVLSNLINNAVKFTNKGAINVAVEKSESEAIIFVKDTGVGIPEDKIDLIWKEFRQASEGFSRNFEGTGLGLTIARKFTELMSGNIEVESKPGEGTTFIITFPLSGMPALQKLPENSGPDKEQTGSALLRKYDILYVEDDSVAVDVVKQMLRNYCNIYNAISLEDALIKAGDNNYNLVLMDINLRRGPDGVEIARKLRELTSMKETPIIAVTAYAMEGDKEDFLSKGMNGYISKPFTKKQLLGLIGEFLDLNSRDRKI
ncbi:MAG: PAS domain S-box protein [Ignavibacteriaceae bacterium]|nr:PAS domain S-box protein [Ignavibacteriaceae bacterium]